MIAHIFARLLALGGKDHKKSQKNDDMSLSVKMDGREDAEDYEVVSGVFDPKSGTVNIYGRKDAEDYEVVSGVFDPKSGTVNIFRTKKN